MNVERNSPIRYNYIWATWKIVAVEAQAAPEGTEESRHKSFGCSMPGLDLAHQPASLGNGEHIHHYGLISWTHGPKKPLPRFDGLPTKQARSSSRLPSSHEVSGRSTQA